MIVLVVGYAVLTIAFLALGLLLDHVLVDHGVGAFDERVTNWLVAHRTAALNTVTSLATFLANTLPVVAIAAVAAALLAVFRRWREVLFLVSALVIELTVFLSVNYVVHRPRPLVERLDSTPSTGSYPSGHTAASLVLWTAIALIVWGLTTNVVVRVIVWIPVAVMPALVGFARVYRGMHFTTDVLAGLVLGAGALGVGCAVTRAWGAAAERPLPLDAEQTESRAPVAAVR